MRAKLGERTALTSLVSGRRLGVFSGIRARRARLDLLGRRALRAVARCRPARPALAARGSRVCGAPATCSQESTLKRSLQEIASSPSVPVRLDRRFRGDERKRRSKICVVARDTRKPRADHQTDSDRRIRRKHRGSSSRHRRSGRANYSRTSRCVHGVCHRPDRDLPPPTERRCCRERRRKLLSQQKNASW